MVEFNANLFSQDFDGNTILQVANSGNLDFITNNISTSLSNIINNNSINVRQPFILSGSNNSGSKLGDGSHFSLGESYCIFFKNVSAYNLLKITTQSQSNAISIAFDTYSKKYPPQVTINGTAFNVTSSLMRFRVNTISENNNYVYNIIIQAPQDENNNYLPFIISGIYLNINYKISKHNLLSLDIDKKDRGTTNKPSFGLYSSSGTIKVKDDDKTLLEYIIYDEIGKGSSFRGTLINNVDNLQEDVALMSVSSVDYDNNNFTATFKLVDDMIYLQDITIPKVLYDASGEVIEALSQSAFPATGETGKIYYEEAYNHSYIWDSTTSSYTQIVRSAKDLLDYVANYLPNYSFIISNDANKILNRTFFKYPTFNTTNAWADLNKIANVCGLYMYNKTSTGGANTIYVDTNISITTTI